MQGKIKGTIDRDGSSYWNSCPEFFEQNQKDVISQIFGKYKLENS